ncbi:MAG: hypothetical protein AAFX76_04320 [Planctomycetota bacterium]
MSSAAFTGLPLPQGPRFSRSVLDEGHTAGRPEPRHGLIERIRSEIENGAYDDRKAISSRLEACLDATLADVLPTH